VEIINRKVKNLIPYDKNPRKNDEAVKYVKASIEQFGFKVPIVIDADGVIVAGHTRLKAAKELGMKEVPCIVADDLTPEQIKAYRLADNMTASKSEWDVELLNTELLDLEANFDMADFGFEIYPPTGEVSEDDFDVDAVADAIAEPVTKLGDIWTLGRHRLMCGDSTDRATVDRLMDGQKADMVFTDPPYGISYQSNGRTKTQKFDVIDNDDVMLDFFPCVKAVCDGWVYVCTTWKVAEKWMGLFKQYYELTNVVIWDKGGGGIGDLYKTFATDYEMILVANNGLEFSGKRHGSVWNFSKDEISKMKKDELLRIVLEQKEYSSVWGVGKDAASEYVHPTQKPVRLSARAIRSSTDAGASILDLFGGSGSTLIACEQLNRTCYMMELDPKYCDVIIKRWESLTGDKAVLLNG
jgi:site-specific DNA-methyltransferase (adenine-specific)